jgi:ribosomal protein S18 acetylase RimI-like enzyme
MTAANRGVAPIQLHKGRATSPQPPAHNCKGLACHAPAQHGTGAKAHPGAAAAAQANRNLAQPRTTGTPQRVENRAQTATNRGANQAASASTAAKAPPAYVVHAPPVIGGGGQVRATIKGTPQVAGSLDMKPIGGGKVYISNLTVERQHRRQGLANQLMSAAMSAARTHGFSTAQLEARPSDSGITSQALVAMYQRLGFKSVGKTRRGNPLMERRF